MVTDATPAEVELQGEAHPDFAEVGDLLARQVGEQGVGGAAVAVYHRGEQVVDLWVGARDEQGTPWDEGTLAMCQSTTKGVTATALHLCVQRGLLDYEDPVVDHWPELGAARSGELRVRHLLTHEAGLFPVSSLVDDGLQLNDWDHMVHALEGATPVHPPGVANGYHAFTFGWLVGELVRRVDGRRVGQVIAEELAEPLGLDGLFLGLPEAEVPRLATFMAQPGADAGPLQAAMAAGEDGAPPAAEPLEWSVANVLAALAPNRLQGWLLDPSTPRAEVPAASGCFTARSLARLYALWAEGGALDGVALFDEQRVATVAEARNDRNDLVLFIPMHWRLGFHPPFTSEGVLRDGFGHNGFGGSGAWADPSRRLSAAYTLNALSGGSAVGDSRFARLATAAVHAADARA